MSVALNEERASTGSFAASVAVLLDEQHRLAGLFGLREEAGLQLVALVAGPGELRSVSTVVEPALTSLPSLTVLAPAADWYERQLHDLYGLEPVGHPDLDPLVAPVDDLPLAPLVSGGGTFTLSYGPVRSGVFEAIEYVVETPGEDIPRVRTRVHYKRRAVEEAFTGRTDEDGVLVAERVEGVAGVAHATAYCEAVERIAGAEVPAQAQLLRALHAEFERVANHLDSTIRHTEAAGQAVAYARFTFHKERLMRLRSQLCGNRFGRGVVVPGGVSGPPLVDLSDGRFAGEVHELCRAVSADLQELMRTPSFIDRLRGTGVLPPTLVRAHGGVGPVGRGSGLPEDVRLSRPYGAYRSLTVPPACRAAGDALARQLVRNEEIASSFEIAAETVRELSGEFASLRAGSWRTPVGRPTGEAVGWAEAPQGEVLYLVRCDDGVLSTVRTRSASFHNLGLFTAAFPKDITTDFAFIEASFGVSIAGVAG